MDQHQFRQIQNQIQEARNSLQNWNDRRAEAMIELDSIFVENEAYQKKVSEDQAAANKLIAELKTNLQKSEQDFHRHFEAYTNDMQELKLQNEILSRQLKTALNDLKKEKEAQKQMEVKYLSKIAQVASETEVRMADQQYQLKTQVNNLVTELQAIRDERKTLEVKADQYEKELRVIRTQMMSFLNVTKEVTAPEVIAPIVVAADTLNTEKKPTTKLQAPAVIVDGFTDSPTTVNDYLKRFGY